MNRYIYSLLGGVLLLACSPTPSTQQETATTTTDSSTVEVVAPDTLMKAEEKRSTVIDSSFTLDYLRGKFVPSKHPDFIKIPRAYTDKEQTYYLRKDVWEAYKEMADSAKVDGVELVIRSATRNFARQKTIWEGKWTGKRLINGNENAASKYPIAKERALQILLYSSMPGTSRHHWGTDIDLNNFNNSWFEKGKGLKLYKWLEANAATYGFCQPYSPKGDERPYGYEEEKWHWSYVPIAQQLTALAQTQLKDEDINGFEGADSAVDIGVVEKYILGVSKACH